MAEVNRYAKLIKFIFDSHYKDGDTEVLFHRDELVKAASKLRIALPKNLGDVIYSFRYRVELPASILGKAPSGTHWIIAPAGRAKYKLVARGVATIQPNKELAETKVPNATPGLIAKYTLNDEQALLARLRYNRLVDIFTGITCYSLQNHLRTSVKDMGQVETDEVYIGIDRKGIHYVLPVQAKGRKDSVGIVQIEQDIAMCAQKFRGLICRPIAAQFVSSELIALFEFEIQHGEVKVSAEKHFRLVLPENISPHELQEYQQRLA